MKKDTSLNRLKAIETLVGSDFGLDAEWYSAFPEKMKGLSRKRLEEMIVDFGKTITDCYVISHGFVAKCCKGRHFKDVKDLLEIRKNY